MFPFVGMRLASLAHIFPLTENAGLLVTCLVLGFYLKFQYFLWLNQNIRRGAYAFLVLKSS